MTNEQYIHQHLEDDVRRLALAKTPEGIDLRWCLQQIEGWQLACRKLPTWAQTEGVWFPPRLSMEQCSTPSTAQYKRTVAERLIGPDERHVMVDLTGGLGVDFSLLAPLFRQATYIDQLPELLELARHNMPLLLANNEATELHFSAPIPWEQLPSNVSLTFLDPARRDGIGRKVVDIADCSPNLLDIQDQLLQKSRWVMVKLSPMLDIRQAIRSLHSVKEIHVVSLEGECKELLFVLSGQGTPKEATATDQPTIHCVNLGTDDVEVVVPYSEVAQSTVHTLSGLVTTSADSSIPSEEATPKEGLFLYEPNASVLKGGVQDALPRLFPVWKLHPMSHLFVGSTLVPHFPGRSFCITAVSDFSKKGLKALLANVGRDRNGRPQANLTVRNFPTSVAQLRQHLSEGGEDYLFATTLMGNRHVIIGCRKASSEHQ